MLLLSSESYIRGGTKVMSPIFFSETVITSIMKFTHIKGLSFRKLRLFFHKLSFIFNKLFPHLHETLYASHIKLFAEVLCFSLLVYAKQQPQTAPFWGPKSGIWRMLNRDCREDEGEHSTPLL
jgi:hypothetical protein